MLPETSHAPASAALDASPNTLSNVPVHASARGALISFNPADENAACPNLGPAVLSIGVFDGVHLGHRALIAAACERAAQRGARPVVVTFERDPDELFCRDEAGFAKLLSNAERLDALAALVADAPEARVLVLSVSPDVLALAPSAFLDALAHVCEPLELHVGEGFRFGAKAAGTLADVRAWAAARDSAPDAAAVFTTPDDAAPSAATPFTTPRRFCATAHALVQQDGAPVTSTRIRALLREGEVAQAAKLCAGRPHAVSGTVAHGRGEGAGMGFATANLDLTANETMLPAEGVYAAWAHVDGARYPSAVNLGVAASFSEAHSPLEAHLLGFAGDIYGKTVRVEFVRRLRAQRVFTDTDELVATVKGDISSVRAMLGEGGHAPYQR